jgi:hypothetical protein
LERAVWMRRSVRRFLRDRCRHVIAVPRQDLAAFRRAFAGDHAVDLTCQEDVVDKIYYPDRLYRVVRAIAPSQAWRLDLRGGLPGWMVQQIVKLSCTHWADEGAVVLIDSDLVFTRPFTFADLGLDGPSRTLVRITPEIESNRHRKHLSRSRLLLDLPAGPTDHHYMSSPTIWYTDWVGQLKARLEQAAGMPWQRALFTAQEFSEYTLYGVFVEEALKPNGLAVRTRPLHRIVHDLVSFQQLLTDLREPEFLRTCALSIVVQSNIGIPVHEYQEILERIVH